MDVSKIAVAQPTAPVFSQAVTPTKPEGTESFGTFLKNAINEVNNAQNNSDVMTNKLITGQDVELHDVMIAAQKASVTLNTALQFRNKAVEAYQEIMRMTV